MLRGLFNGASLLLWFTALSMVLLGDATALSLLGLLFVAMGAMFFGEKVHGPRWLALVIGFAGARDCPARISANRSGHDAGACLDVIRHVFETDCQVFVRTDQPSTIVAYLSLTMMQPSGVALFFVWQTPT